MKKQYRILSGKVTPESLSEGQKRLMEVENWAKEGLEKLAAEAGLMILDGIMSGEIAQRLGKRGEQEAYRHGHQPGYVVFDGRKVAVKRPRVRSKGGEEVRLESYERFQEDGARQRVVARHLMRHCSSRNYQGALNECLEGYGVAKSTVSREWKLATQKQLEELLHRPVPKDLVAVMVDGKHFQNDCIVVALGVDGAGKKHVLGLWQGSTENSTLVKDLLTDLVQRGLDPAQPVLVVLDGAKALHKAVREVFGDRAVVQRCRIHKQRNVLDYLPKPKRSKIAWRLQVAWALEDWQQARKELESIVRDLEKISPSAARSLEEGMDETLTLHRLEINDVLLKSLASTNLIESTFSQAEAYCGRVKRWRNSNMVMRWSASALLWSEKQFRKVRGFKHLPQLKAALHNAVLAPKQKAA